MPVGCLLKTMGNIEQFGFRKIIADQLHANGFAIAQTRWNRYSRQTCQVDRNGVNILQVQGDWISGFLADTKGR